MERCPWARTDLSIAYHDTEWGVPQHDDRTLFEFLVLEGAQAGLSWETILRKRQTYRDAFDQFDPAVVARYTKRQRERLLRNPGIVRNRLKVEAAVQNAKALLTVQQECGTFANYVWGFVGQQPKQNAWKSVNDVPVTTPESDALSKNLKRRGFRFVGSTICYAFMQAVGLVNDHLVGCFRHAELTQREALEQWFVYVLRCADGSLYTGIAKDVQRRQRQHNAGTASRYTRSRLPTQVVYEEAYPSQSLALRREAAIKALSRQQKEALIRSCR